VVTFATITVLRHSSPTLQIRVAPMWVLRAVGMAIAASVLGALYPSYRAAQADPIEALSYE